MLSKMSNDKDAAKKYFVYSTSKMADEATNSFSVSVSHFCQHQYHFNIFIEYEITEKNHLHQSQMKRQKLQAVYPAAEVAAYSFLFKKPFYTGCVFMIHLHKKCLKTTGWPCIFHTKCEYNTMKK